MNRRDLFLNASRLCPVAALLLGVLVVPAVLTAAEVEPSSGQDEPVSYYRQVRPILQRHCSGCHQPAKAGGKLLLTSFEGLQKGGEIGESFVAGKPDESLLIDYISGDEPMMPLNGDKLSPQQVETIARWIKEGAKNDTPESVEENVSAKNPPKYASPPVITALAYSPDGRLLAVSGFHEVLVHKADGSGLEARLIGQAQRIESLAFSPDGKRIAAVGGTPALFGEVQLWDVAGKKLALSKTISHDALFGGSFNGDGTLLAFGGADNRARIIRVEDGEQVMQLDTHSDWVFDTTFSLDLENRPAADKIPIPKGEQRERIVGQFDAGEHLITVSRDMSMKLTLVARGQFIDNVTSITPGALKGGLIAVQRHPHKDQVLTGGADGEPKLYKIFRTRARQIGDDYNHIRSYEKMPGRIFDLELNNDGSLFVAGSSTATGGAARIYKTGEYDTHGINNEGGLGQVNQQIAKRSAEKALVHELPGIEGPVYAVAFRPDGKQVAVGGFDGHVRLYDVETGKLVKQFLPVEVTPAATAAK